MDTALSRRPLARMFLALLAITAATVIGPGCAGHSGEATDSSRSAVAQTFALPGQVQASGYSALTGTMKLEACSDTGGGQDLGYTSAGGTVQFNVSVAAGGAFNATYRVASAQGGSFDVLIDGTKVDTITVANTGGWQDWTTVSGSGPYSIAAGNHLLQLTVDAVAYNLNWVSFSATPTYALPGQVQASGYSALTGTMKLEACSDTGGGEDLGYTSVGGTVKFSVSVAAGGSFNATYRVASAQGGSFDVAIDGTKVDTVTVPNTGGWQDWTSVSGSAPYSIAAGNHVLQVTVDAVGYNLNWVSFSANTTPTFALPGQVQASGFSALTGTMKLEACSDTGGGEDLGYTSVGGTVQFNVSVAAGGAFSATYRVASAQGGSFDVAIDGTKVDTITVANTGGWQDWTTVSGSGPYSIAAGNHVLQVTVDAVAYNLNWVSFSGASCVLPGGSYAASCAACAAGPASSGCVLTCASCNEENGGQNADPSLPLPCASGLVSNNNGSLVCDSSPPPGGQGAPLVIPATGGAGAHLVTVGSANRLELHGVVVWGIEDFVTTSFAAGEHTNRDAVATTIAAWGGNVIRLRVLADEYVHLTYMGSTANYLQWIKDWVAAAEAHGLFVQICWWDSLDSSNSSKNDANWASQYGFAFPMMTDVHNALKLANGTDDPSVFYEPFNEPNNVSWTQWLPAMEATLSEFRKTAGYQGMLIIDTTTWSHDYSDQYMGQLEAYDATLASSGQSNLAFARHDYTNDYGNNFTGGAWVANTGGGETAHVMYETEFGNYNGPGIQSNAWSAAITSYFKTDLYDRSNIAGADAFLFGNWSDANALSSDPSGNSPTNPWGDDVQNWLSAYK